MIKFLLLDSLFSQFNFQRLLGVQSRPNPLEDWDQLYNLNNQVGLRNDCRKLAKLLDNKKSVPELESFMTLYCKRRNVDYKKDSGWIVVNFMYPFSIAQKLGIKNLDFAEISLVLEKILKFDLPQEHVFNVFFAFTTKYIPKSAIFCISDITLACTKVMFRETKESAQIYDLFRLLLQYHDPQISSHLDSLKCPPHCYASQWFSTILAASVNDEVCKVLWELYIEKVCLACTIWCCDFHYLIFGSNYDDEAGDLKVSKLLCLPVTVQELVKKDRAAVTVSFPTAS
ncbi:unnamed protein product [Strongylus vulgaris]|uniref:Rab-GAP TBC domain-containing protein n=1 Tax=Strongylus vulgaris TaxID=40348 RepID=A0A3P7JEG2_STRVU|nr:unnamed protein product [Strongylus vulgaris]